MTVVTQSRSFHLKAPAFAQVPMSKFDPDAYLPYDKLKKNFGVVKNR